MSKWILTSEREPEKAGDYIVTWFGEVTLMSWYNGWNKHNDDDKYEISSSNIKAWMPLPEPYKESEEDVNR